MTRKKPLAAAVIAACLLITGTGCTMLPAGNPSMGIIDIVPTPAPELTSTPEPTPVLQTPPVATASPEPAVTDALAAATPDPNVGQMCIRDRNRPAFEECGERLPMK